MIRAQILIGTFVSYLWLNIRVFYLFYFFQILIPHIRLESSNTPVHSEGFTYMYVHMKTEVLFSASKEDLHKTKLAG